MRPLLPYKPKKQLAEYTFVDHLEELRYVLIRCLIAVVLCAVLGFIYLDFFFNQVLMAPTHKDFPTYRIFCALGHYLGWEDKFCIKNKPIQLQSTKMGAQFLMSFSIALAIGVLLSFPYIVRQIWRFIRPALNPRELKNTNHILFYISVLFFIGVGFGYFIITPYTIQFFANYTLSDAIENRFLVSDYIATVLQLSLGSGLFFQFPLLLYTLGKIGILSSSSLKKYRKYALLILLLVAAIITPPDILSQVILTAPLYALYEISILIIEKVERNAPKK